MTPATAIDNGSATKRRWRIPPPLLQDGQGPGPEGLAVLGEFRGELGAVLWKSLRSVLLWAEASPASRRNLFAPETVERRQLEILSTIGDEETALRESLEDLLPILAKPERADPEFTGIACNRIATWAQGRGAPLTRLEFLQAAAVACPANADFALAVGRAARDLAYYGRAEAWLYRTVGLARQATDWVCYVEAYLGHGIMMFRRGALPSARRSFLKSLRRSRRQGLRDGQARALHHLFTLEFRAGQFTKAMAYASDALEAYGPTHERLPHLAHDIAYAWMERGDWQHSLPVFLETLGHVAPSERPAVLGSLGRAAAAGRDVAAYEWALSALREHEPAPGVAEAWVDLARAALSLDRHEEAEEAAGLAEAVARSRREGQMRFLAESVMDRIGSERAAASEAAARTVEEDEAADRASEANDILARDLIRSLQEAGAMAGRPNALSA